MRLFSYILFLSSYFQLNCIRTRFFYYLFIFSVSGTRKLNEFEMFWDLRQINSKTKTSDFANVEKTIWWATHDVHLLVKLNLFIFFSVWTSKFFCVILITFEIHRLEHHRIENDYFWCKREQKFASIFYFIAWESALSRDSAIMKFNFTFYSDICLYSVAAAAAAAFQIVSIVGHFIDNLIFFHHFISHAINAMKQENKVQSINDAIKARQKSI